MNEETLKDIDRAFKALEEREELLDKIIAEIERQREKVSKKHFENDNALQVYHFGLNDGLKDARDIIDKYKE